MDLSIHIHYLIHIFSMSLLLYMLIGYKINIVYGCVDEIYCNAPEEKRIKRDILFF